MLDLSTRHFCEPICEIPAEWIAAFSLDGEWVIQSSPEKPRRLHQPPAAEKIIRHVIEAIGVPCTAYEVVLSGTQPGHHHDMHADGRAEGWLTRVHVPLRSNEGCWHEFADQPSGKFRMLTGWAYTFNARFQRHAFGNDGTTPRVHLMFDLQATT